MAHRHTFITILTLLATTPLTSQQESDPNRLFVRVQTQLRPQPSTPLTPQLPILRPGTLLTTTGEQSGGLVQVATANGQKGWVPATAARSLAVLQAEQQLEAFGGLEGISPMDRTTAKAAQCFPFPSCPVVGCATTAKHKLTNTRKRTFPGPKAPVKVLTFDDLDLLQALTDSKGIPQGEHLTAAQRKQLTNFKIGVHSISEGDHIAVTGFIAQDRTIRCGGAESVNCSHTEPRAEIPPAHAPTSTFPWLNR